MSAQPGSEEKAATGGKWLWALVALIIGFVAVSGDSLWIDEALTANEVSHASIHGVWQMLAHDKASDLQMPLYIFHLWLWVKIFGTSEWALRAVNILWFTAGFSAFMTAFAGRERRGLALVALVCPFTWYFLNEARPYAMQIGASLIVFAAICRLGRGEDWSSAITRFMIGKTPDALRAELKSPVHAVERLMADALQLTPWSERCWVAACCFGLVALSGSSLLGMIWAVAFALAAAWIIPRERFFELARAHLLAVRVLLVLLMTLGIYYLWTLHVGARATAGTTDARNLVFIAYELLGFGGLGPGRLEIRGSAAAALVPYALPLAIYGALLLFVLLAGLRSVARELSPPRLRGVLTCLALPALVILGAGRLLHFRVLERHFAPVMVLVVYVLGAGVAESWRRRRVLPRLAVCGFVGLSLWSCLELRFAPRQKKDDYRDAAAFAKNALSLGHIVWWNASDQGAVYYHLALSNGANESNAAVLLRNPGALSALPAPDVVIVSKPDLFDAKGSVAEIIRNGPYARTASFPAFTVWQRAPRP